MLSVSSAVGQVFECELNALVGLCIHECKSSDQVNFGPTDSLSYPFVFWPDLVAVTVIFRAGFTPQGLVECVGHHPYSQMLRNNLIFQFCCSSVFLKPWQSYKAVTVSHLCTATSLCILVLALGYLDFLFILKLMHDLFEMSSPL